jgi:hypothetical protein
MRKIIHAIFVILAVVVLVLCSACVLPSGDQKSKQEGGLTLVTVPVETSRISFEDAYQNLKEYRTGSINNSPIPSEKIYYILGKDVDDQGKATSWVFGVKNDAGFRLLIYDRTGWTDMSLSNSALPSEYIMIDQIVPPGNLFSDNKAAILGNSPSTLPELRELELKEVMYTLTITSGRVVRAIKFNATTGALIV